MDFVSGVQSAVAIAQRLVFTNEPFAGDPNFFARRQRHMCIRDNHIPYLYNYAGQPWKTQKRIRQMLKTWFRNDLMGMPGDEDGGGMTSFVVFSSLGFYPVTPGLPVYNIGSPLFPNTKITLDNGSIFEIDAQNASDENKYIQSATLNGQEWNKPWFSHDDLKNGGKLMLIMGNKPNKTWGNGMNAAPPSANYK